MNRFLHRKARGATHVLLAAGIMWCMSGAALAEVVATLGNPTPAFNDGDFPGVLQITDPLVSDGSDPIANFDTDWTFNYTPPGQPIAAASIMIGIVDHDSASPGTQVSAFSVDGFDLTSELNALFEARGGDSGEYNVYSLALPSGAFSSLEDGSATLALALQGPVLSPSIFGGPPVEENFNGATVVFSSLDIAPVPEPSTFALLGLGALATIAIARRRRRR